MLILNEDECFKSISVKEAITESARAFREIATGKAEVPERIKLVVPNEGITLFKPAFVDGILGQKLVSVREKNSSRNPPLPTVPAVILLLDPATGLPNALLSATYITALRTAAGSAVATHIMAKPDAKDMVVFGAGEQARQHVRTIAAVRPSLRNVTFVCRDPSKAASLVEDLKMECMNIHFNVIAATNEGDVEKMLGRAEVVVTATSSKDAVLNARHALVLRPGTHINSVGAYTPDAQEVAAEVVARCAIVLDCAAATEAGDLHLPLRAGTLTQRECSTLLGSLVTGGGEEWKAELGALARWRAAAGPTRELTWFKSVGTASQDLTTAHRVYLNARKFRGLMVKL